MYKGPEVSHLSEQPHSHCRENQGSHQGTGRAITGELGHTGLVGVWLEGLSHGQDLSDYVAEERLNGPRAEVAML